VQFLRHDALVKRFVGWNVLPEERTLSRWLGRFTNDTLPALSNLSREIVLLSIGRLKLRTLTIDLDGTVISTGLQVAVGTPVARCPPRRSQRAELPHWAPILDSGVKALFGPRMQDLTRRKPPPDVALHASPGRPVTLTASPERA
jgi:hypothetical protein